MTEPTNPSLTEMFDALDVPDHVRPAARAFGSQVIAATDELVLLAARTHGHMQRREIEGAKAGGDALLRLMNGLDVTMLQSVAVQLAYAVVEAHQQASER